MGGRCRDASASLSCRTPPRNRSARGAAEIATAAADAGLASPSESLYHASAPPFCCSALLCSALLLLLTRTRDMRSARRAGQQKSASLAAPPDAASSTVSVTLAICDLRLICWGGRGGGGGGDEEAGDSIWCRSSSYCGAYV